MKDIQMLDLPGSMDTNTGHIFFLQQWNDACREYAHFPAIEDRKCVLSYRDLDQIADRIAAELEDRTIGRGDRVAICCQRGSALVASLLATLKIGAVFTLVDMDLPRQRLERQMCIFKPSAILVTSDLPSDLPLFGQVIDIGQMRSNAHGPVPITSPALSPDDAAYIIFSSGSTGVPKAIVLPHRGIPNLAQHAGVYGIQSTTRVLMFSPICFDAIIAEIVMTLATGACLVAVENEDLRDMDKFKSVLCDQKIDVATLPPTLVSILPPDLPVSLSTLIVAGERCGPDVIPRWSRKLRLLNAYGPSEATVAATVCLCHPETDPGNIGKVLANVTVRILDEDGNDLPAGECGEINISGPGIALCYLDAPDLTEQKFYLDKLNGQRAYRSGDYARYLSDGSIVFEGRKDDLVKINGNRVELGDLEACVNALPGIRTSYATAPEDPVERKIFLFVVPADPGAGLSEDLVRSHIGTQLPTYFTPSTIAFVEKFPRLPSGKVDAKELIARTTLRKTEHSRSLTGSEETVSAIWEELLNKPVSDPQISFFALGGTSLTAMRLVAMLKQRGVSITLKQIYDSATIKSIAEQLDAQV